jgi:hypothetical protein
MPSRRRAATLGFAVCLLVGAFMWGVQDPPVSRKDKSGKALFLRSHRSERPNRPAATDPKVDLKAALEKASAHRGKFLTEFFRSSPMDASLVRLNLEGALKVFASEGIEPGSDDEIALLSRYLEVNKALDPGQFAKLVRARDIPDLTNRIAGTLATREPELALQLVDETIANAPLREIALLNLFNGAANSDIDRAAKLAATLQKPRERGQVAVEILSSYQTARIPFSNLAPLILNNESTFIGSDKTYAVQAMANHPVPAVLREFDTTTAWHKTLVVGYLVRRNRTSPRDVERYLASPESSELLTGSERGLIEATRNADVIPPEH